MQRFYTLLMILAYLWLLSGCATNPVTGEADFVLMSEEQEIALGAKTHKDVMKQYKEYDHPELQALVNNLGQELATQSHRGHLDYTFTLLDSPQVNAFATPGGYVYINRGIVAYMNNEEQLAGVLGHELGHVTARHSVRQHSAQTTAGIVSIIAAMATGSRDVAEATGQFGQAFVSGYGRNHELEADRLGAEYLAGIGYDPEMMLGVIGILKDQEEFERQRARDENREPRTYHGVYSTHPRNDQRLQEVIRAAEKYRNPNARYSNPEEFRRILDGVTFGNSEDQGVLRGSRFYHKPLNLTIEFPDKWRVDNQPSQLVALNPQQNSALLIRLGDPGDANTPEQFLRQNFENVNDIERIDGDSSSGVTQGRTPFGQVPVRVAAVFHDDKVLVVNGFAKSGLPDKNFFDTVQSVRKLKSKERKLASSKKIKVVRARQGDTFARLARKSNLQQYGEENLRLLNGMYPDGEPEPGQLIKIIQ
ncbi:MAG: M48 family metalloprotease [bacterium]